MTSPTLSLTTLKDSKSVRLSALQMRFLKRSAVLTAHLAVCDPKSLLYLFGMELGYSTQLIGGGFQFQNPNAESSCGCGKSFSA